MNEYVRETEAKFIQNWEAKRGDKRKIYLQNFLLWGVVVSNIVYFFSIDFKFSSFDIQDYLLRFVVYAIGSQLLARIKIRSQERQYRKIMERRNQETTD